jgi:co-chaperonin GroES (HSP10)
MVDPAKIRAFGPWVLVNVETVEKHGDLYLPQGSTEERCGHRIGVVLSVGQGYFNKCKNGKSPETKFSPIGVKVGDRIQFKGFLHDVNKYHQGVEGLQCSMIHANDIEGVVEQ